MVASRRSRTSATFRTSPPKSTWAENRFGPLDRGQDMRRVMVRYKVKPERAADNEHYIRDVFLQLAKERPAGLRYASFKLADGVSFVHIASVETADGANPLNALAAFKA